MTTSTRTLYIIHTAKMLKIKVKPLSYVAFLRIANKLA